MTQDRPDRPSSESDRLPGDTRVGEVVLRVRSASDVADFYRDVVGLAPRRVDGRVELSADGGRSLVTLVEDPDAPGRRADAAGLYHVAVRVPDRRALGDALARIRRSEWSLDGAADHVASEALYLSDPEGNGVEVYADRPRDEWEYTDDGQVHLPGDPLDRSVLEAAASPDLVDRVPPGTDVGHVHLEVTDLQAAITFYRDVLGFDQRLRKPRASFLAGGDYHHHLAVNTRGGRTTGYRPDALGLASVEFTVPDAAFDALRDRLLAHDVPTTARGASVRVEDPDGIPVVFSSQG